MAGILDQLEPLTALVVAESDPLGTCAALIAATQTGEGTPLIAVLGNPKIIRPALRFAGILREDDQLTAAAHDQLIRLETLVAARTADRDRWQPVMTVPPFLRGAIQEGVVTETLSALLNLTSNARRKLVMASPFLDRGFETLIPALSRLIAAGGDVLLITRELTNPASHNSAVAHALRRECGASARLSVVSWEEDGLGLHMKAAVADSLSAYIGSANLTWGGMSQHAELGVILNGPSVLQVEELLIALAVELRARRHLQAR